MTLDEWHKEKNRLKRRWLKAQHKYRKFVHKRSRGSHMNGGQDRKRAEISAKLSDAEAAFMAYKRLYPGEEQ